MSLENIVIAVSLLLGIVLLILIIYLISRVNDLEAKAFSNLGAAPSKKTETEPQKIFAGLMAVNCGMNGCNGMAPTISMASRVIEIAFWPYSNFTYDPSLKRAWSTARRARANRPPTR